MSNYHVGLRAKKVLYWFQYGDPNLWQWIIIAISTACNYRCHYCPQSLTPQKQNIISPELWQIFLSRVRESGWRGRINLSFYNEPSVVPHSERYVKDITDIGCKAYIPTNGSKPDVIEKWVQAGAWQIDVTEHPPFKPEWGQKLLPVAAKYPRVIRVNRLKPENLYSRGGKISVERPKIFDRCISQVQSLYIDWDGRPFICCEDYDLTSKTQENIREKTLKELWYKSPLAKKRELVRKGISALPICNYCFGKKVPEPAQKKSSNPLPKESPITPETTMQNV